MKKLYAVAVLFALSFAAAAAPAALATKAADEPEAKAPLAVGEVAPDFTLPDAGGRRHTLASLKGKSGTVIIFVATKCPVSNAYNARMQKMAEEFRARGVNVVGINSNAGEPAEEVRRHAAEKGLAFTILKDAGNKVADRFEARVTPEAYLLDAAGRLVYRGRIDNSRSGDSISSTELRDAVEAVLAGKPVEKSEVKAFGCSIKRG
jgi:peroxiredoxin